MIGHSVAFLKSIGKHPGCNDLKPSPPPAPDYEGAAKETAAGNLEAAKYTTEANRINQYTPYGSMTYAKDPAGKWSQTVSLSPEQQQLLNQQNQTSLALGNTMDKGVGYVQNMLDNPFDTSQLPNIPTTADNAGRDAMTASILERMQPSLDRNRQLSENQLLVQGHNRGGEAWNANQDDMARAENDARLGAVQAGGAEQSRMFGLGTTARQNALEEQSFLRNEPLNTLNAVRTGAQVTGPQFQSAPMQQGVAGPDLLGAANATGQYNQGVYNSQSAGAGNLLGGLFSLGGALGGAAIKASDRRLKKNIQRIGTHALGIGLYAWEYLWGERATGVMADEVETVMPEAIVMHPSGFKMVNYSMIGG